MQPQAQSDTFKPKWRHFHPQSTVWVQNPFDHDVTFKVADEHNQQYTYRLQQGKVSELPGGPVATLGVKAIVDELCQSNMSENLRIWDEEVRSKHEENIIVRYKEAPRTQPNTAVPGEIDLTVRGKDVPKETEPLQPEPQEQAFPDLDVAKDEAAKAEVENIAAASLGGKPAATIIEES